MKKLNNLKLFIWERKVLKKNKNIFFPDNKFLYIFLVLSIIIPILIFGCINGRMAILMKSLLQVKLILLFGCIFLFLIIEISARQISIYDGYLIQRSCFVKEEKIKISEIRNCKITTGRKKGEAVVNLKIIENISGKIININMVAYKKYSIRKITELLGYPDLIKK